MDRYHVLIVGRTGSGKTVMGKTLCRQYRAAGWKCLVLDPYKDSGWKAHHVTADPGEFLALAKRLRNCQLFADESYRTIGRENDPELQKQMAWLTIESRHNGHQSHILAQSPVQVVPTLRDGCESYIIFRLAPDYLEEIRKKTGEQDIMAAATLGRGEFLQYVPWKPLKKGKLDFAKGKITSLQALKTSRNSRLSP